jgi:arginine N-succinyltransferase
MSATSTPSSSLSPPPGPGLAPPQALQLRAWRDSDAQCLRDVDGQALAAPSAGQHCWVLCAAGAEAAALASLRLAQEIGQALPRYSYHVGQAVHAAAELQLHLRQRTLLLGNDLTGADELCGFGWAASAAPLPAAAWRLLVQAGLQAWAGRAGEPGVVAAEPGTAAAAASLASPQPPGALVAELPGLRSAQGQSPFWQGLGRHFYPREPRQAWADHGPAWRSHVGALLPRQPLYASFLGAEAQAAIGAVHPAVAGLVQALQEAGFRWQGQVAVDDGGPVLQR